MKIGAAQTKPVKGDIEKNMAAHKQLIQLAIDAGASTIIFPELSMTGYEPQLAKDLAVHLHDARFDSFQQISNEKHITIGLGMPVKTEEGIVIGMLIFQPQRNRKLYAKQHLHADEYPYFVRGKEQVYLSNNNYKMALAICYELTVPAHAANTHQNGAGIYFASVAKTPNGVDKAIESLSGIAQDYSMQVFLSNCTGLCDGEQCGGKTSAWNNKGELIGQLDDNSEGILVVDISTNEVIIKTI